eukprot:gb/GECG01015924.1/.p1 GENE.gb/GECG01015924.1/~~gb/GECG01015924.1/.p1  ORF type:complete len:907 (+),score=154.39 gb/GECG01015924.1/:1-2721(+)
MSAGAYKDNNIRETQKEAFREREEIIQRSFPSMKKWYKNSTILGENFGSFPMFWQDFLTWEHERVVMKAYLNHLEGMSDQEALDSALKKTQQEASTSGTRSDKMTEQTIQHSATESTESSATTSATSEVSAKEQNQTETSKGETAAEKEKRRRKRRRWDKDTEDTSPETENGGQTITETQTTTTGTTDTTTKTTGKKRKKNRWSVDPEVEERKEVEQQIWKLQKLAADTNVGEVLSKGSAAIQEVQDKVDRICGKDGLQGVLEKAQKHGVANNLGLSNLGAVLGDETSSATFGGGNHSQSTQQDSRTRQLEITKELQSLNWKIDHVDALAAAERHNPKRPPSPAPQYDSMGRRTNKLEQRMKEQFMDRKSELTRELVGLNPAMKSLYDQGLLGKKEKVTRKIYIPVDEYPEYNFMGIIIGPRGQTQKKLETESNCKISVRGRGANKEGKLQPQEGSDDDLHVWIQGDNEEDVEACATLIERLLEPRDEDDEWRQQQMKDLAIINGTFRQQDQLIATEVKNMNYDTAADLEKVLQTVGEGAAKREEAIRKGRNLEEVEADETQDADYLRYIQQLTGKTQTSTTQTSVQNSENVGTSSEAATSAGESSATTMTAEQEREMEEIWKLPSLDQQKKQREQRFQPSSKGSESTASTVPTVTQVPVAPSQPVPYPYQTSGAYSAPHTGYTYPSYVQQPMTYTGFSQPMPTGGVMAHSSQPGSAPVVASGPLTSNTPGLQYPHVSGQQQAQTSMQGVSNQMNSQTWCAPQAVNGASTVPQYYYQAQGPPNAPSSMPQAVGVQQPYQFYGNQSQPAPYVPSATPYQQQSGAPQGQVMYPGMSYQPPPPSGFPGVSSGMPPQSAYQSHPVNPSQWNPYFANYGVNPMMLQRSNAGRMPSHPALGMPRHRLYYSKQ